MYLFLYLSYKRRAYDCVCVKTESQKEFNIFLSSPSAFGPIQFSLIISVLINFILQTAWFNFVTFFAHNVCAERCPRVFSRELFFAISAFFFCFNFKGKEMQGIFFSFCFTPERQGTWTRAIASLVHEGTRMEDDGIYDGIQEQESSNGLRENNKNGGVRTQHTLAQTISFPIFISGDLPLASRVSLVSV